MTGAGPSPRPPSAALREFWRERRLCMLTTRRPDGTPHLVPVGVTVSDDFSRAWVISRRNSVKVRNVRTGDQHVAVSQVDGGRWSTLEGLATVLEDAESVRGAEDRYAVRYRRQPAPNPQRVVVEIDLTRRLGMA